MVRLSYKFKLNASFQQVWNYFSNFANIMEYDPCVKNSKLIQPAQKNIGKKYDVTTYFNGKQSKMIYQVIDEEKKKQGSLRNHFIKIYGQNDKLTSQDVITVRQIAEQGSKYNLLLQYQADICFRGIYWFMTPFALSALNQLQLNAQKGARKRSMQKWGEKCLQL